MIYLVAGLALLGCVVIASSRRRVEARPMCPNCGAALQSFATDRCPECLLWQPPDRDKPHYAWQRHRATVGILLVVLPLIVFLIVPLVIRETFAPSPVSMPLLGFPTTPPALPPALRGLTPAQIAQLRALGYLPSPRGTTMPTTTSPSGRPSLPPTVLKALRSAGYLAEAEEPEAGSDGIADEASPASDDGPCAVSAAPLGPPSPTPVDIT